MTEESGIVMHAIREFIREELQTDYSNILEVDGLWIVDAARLEDGSLIAIFEFLYDEDWPYCDYSATVTFQGSVHVDASGQLKAKSMEVVDMEHRASGPRFFLEGKGVSQGNRRKEAIEWEATLGVGDPVDARFTKNGMCYRFLGQIVKVNAKSFRVAPMELVYSRMRGRNPLHEGESAATPRRVSSSFSTHSGVFPVAAHTG